MTDDHTVSAYMLRRLDARTWLILNRTHLPSDTRHSVAWIRETGLGRVEVDWSRAIPLPTAYASAVEALEDFRNWVEQANRDNRPRPIRHFPPPNSH